jgi:hypothetical protein
MTLWIGPYKISSVILDAKPAQNIFLMKHPIFISAQFWNKHFMGFWFVKMLRREAENISKVSFELHLSYYMYQHLISFIIFTFWSSLQGQLEPNLVEMFMEMDISECSLW